MSKIWICGICQNNAQDIKEIFERIKLLICGVDLGGVWVDGGSTDDTVKTLESYGINVVKRNWTNDHDFQMNAYLRSGHIKHGDWVIQLDTSERIHWLFLEKLEDGMLDNFEKQNINTIYQRSKPIMFRYHDDQIFAGNPHWGLQGQKQHAVDISKFDGFEDDKKYLWSNRDDINKWITNGMKYYYVYGRSNHMWLVYNPANYPNSTRNLIHEHEARRVEFRNYCRDELRLSMDNLDDITKFLMSEKLPSKLIEFMNYEKIIASYFRYMNGEDQQKIYDTQNSWKF